MTYSELSKAMAYVTYTKNGEQLRLASRETKIPASTLCRWVKQQWWIDFQTQPQKKIGDKKIKKRNYSNVRPSKLTKKVIDLVIEFYTQNEASYQKQLRQYLLEKGVVISMTSVGRAIKMANFSRKRLSSHVLGKQDPEKVKTFCSTFKPLLEQKTENVIVSTDESYFSEKVIPRYAYSTIGTKPQLKKRSGAGGWKQRSLIQSVASDGTKYYEIHQGPVNRKRFGEYITKLPYPKGSIILLDNCTVHKSLDAILNEKGYKAVFLSPYSPEFQPVEFVFSKIKTDFRGQYPWKDGVESSIEKGNYQCYRR